MPVNFLKCSAWGIHMPYNLYEYLRETNNYWITYLLDGLPKVHENVY